MNKKQLLNIAKALDQFDDVIDVINVSEDFSIVHLIFRFIGEMSYKSISFNVNLSSKEENISLFIKHKIKELKEEQSK